MIDDAGERSLTRPQTTVDARAWLAWLLAAATLTMVARNPLYSLIILLAAHSVTITRGQPRTVLPLSLWRLALVILPLAILFNMLSVHIGQTVLARLPESWPFIGGVITLEAAVYGAANGLLLLALLAVFLAFNATVPVNALVRLTPRAFHDLGVVTLIALTYVPETITHLKRIRDAQAIRGHRLRGVRDWAPVVIPLLIGGLERAMGLAEAMVARGYGAMAVTRQSTWVRALLALSLVVALTGWLVALWWGWPGWLLLLAAGVGVMALIQWRSRAVAHSRYRPSKWGYEETALLTVALLPLIVILLPGPFVDQSTLTYSPYPLWQWPPFDAFIGLSLAALALPAFWPLMSDSQRLRAT
jgi:energy-coupling factor transport system permease protein